MKYKYSFILTIFILAQIFAMSHSYQHLLVDKKDQHHQACEVCLKADNHQISFTKSPYIKLESTDFDLEFLVKKISLSNSFRFFNIRSPPFYV